MSLDELDTLERQRQAVSRFTDPTADDPLGAAVHERHLRLTDKSRSHGSD